MRSDQLGCDHAFDFVLRTDTDEAGDGGAVLLNAPLIVQMLDPKRIEGLVAQNLVPIVRLRSAYAFQHTL
jgi:hypothetical protein